MVSSRYSSRPLVAGDWEGSGGIIRRGIRSRARVVRCLYLGDRRIVWNVRIVRLHVTLRDEGSDHAGHYKSDAAKNATDGGPNVNASMDKT
ncbi:hypothetical protein PISMIDRAFT_683951 [Pisolithus microcarpus 441]|uniref:Uncharacterized protein n=1 Tax=Pisolithus microcarpus 441 TaxID=765257 RepID=A0A0C9ZFL7_9AGAM|nr:hypothetical protein PISMIDRAFT_683951 [Pisolithus microcarpus 441]